MMRFLRYSFLANFCLILLAGAPISGQGPFELVQLDGDWEGTGMFLMPVTHIKMDIAGQAIFTYDSTDHYLRTAITGTKFIFKYSDSGKLIRDPVTDSISWEVWDNFGKHAKYYGTIEDGVIRGTRTKGNKSYSVAIDLVSSDTIDFRLTQTNADSSSFDRAVFHLWRVE